MHEMSLTESVVRILEQEAARQGFSRVRRVWLEIGALSHVAPEAIAFCFQAAARDSVADGARLDILRVEGAAWCPTCARDVEIAQRFDPCPGCGGHDLHITAGEELRVKEVEVE